MHQYITHSCTITRWLKLFLDTPDTGINRTSMDLSIQVDCTSNLPFGLKSIIYSWWQIPVTDPTESATQRLL